MLIDRARRLRSDATRLLAKANETVQRSRTILGQSKALEQTFKASSNGRNQNAEQKLNYKKAANNARNYSTKARNSSDEHLRHLTQMQDTATTAAEHAAECKRQQRKMRNGRGGREQDSGVSQT